LLSKLYRILLLPTLSTADSETDFGKALTVWIIKARTGFVITAWQLTTAGTATT